VAIGAGEKPVNHVRPRQVQALFGNFGIAKSEQWLGFVSEELCDGCHNVFSFPVSGFGAGEVAVTQPISTAEGHNPVHGASRLPDTVAAALLPSALTSAAGRRRGFSFSPAQTWRVSASKINRPPSFVIR